MKLLIIMMMLLLILIMILMNNIIVESNIKIKTLIKYFFIKSFLINYKLKEKKIRRQIDYFFSFICLERNLFFILKKSFTKNLIIFIKFLNYLFILCLNKKNYFYLIFRLIFLLIIRVYEFIM